MLWEWTQDCHREWHTDGTIAASRPDIVLRSKKDKTCLLIDMTIPLDTNTSVKTMEKLTKYVQRLGNQGWANVGAQNNRSPGGYESPWHHQEGHGKLFQQTSCQHQRTWTPENNSPFYSPPCQAGPLHQVETPLPTKVHGLDSDVKRENQSQLH